MKILNNLMSFIGVADEEYKENKPIKESVSSRNKPTSHNVVALHSQKNIRFVLFEPKSFDDTQEIADNLKGHRPVLINLQRIPRDQGSKLIDFLSGTIYALGGNIQKVGPHIFICAPANIDIQGSISDIFLQDKNKE